MDEKKDGKLLSNGWLGYYFVIYCYYKCFAKRNEFQKIWYKMST